MSIDNKQLETKIANMEKELAEMKKILATPELTTTYWTPKRYEEYWYVSNSLQVLPLSNSDNLGDRYRTFKTNDEAKKYAEYIRAEETLKQAIANLNNGWVPDFYSSKQDKFCLYLQCNSSTEVYIDRWLYRKEQPTFMYMKSKEIAEIIRTQYKDTLITYFSY